MSDSLKDALLWVSEPVIGFAAWAYPVLFVSCGWPAGQMAGVLFVAAIGSGILRTGNALPRGLLLGFGALATVLVRLVNDLTLDPTSHNLFPLELALTLAIGIPPSMIGLPIGTFLGQLGSRAVRLIAGSAVLLLAAAMPVIFNSRARQEAIRDEAAGMAGMKILTAVLMKNPSEALALPGSCDVLLTSEARREAGLDLRNWMSPSIGNLTSGGYFFHARCSGSRFVLGGSPIDTERRMHSFCSDNSGVIRSEELGKSPRARGFQCSGTGRTF